MGSDAFAVQLNDAFKKKLLGLGGYGVSVPQASVPMHPLIITYGKIFDACQLQREIMEASRPHHNTAELWLQSEAGVTMCTGFALAADGFWKRHSWLLGLKRNIIETTAAHEKYYGIGLRASLDRHGAADFIKQMYLGDPLQSKLFADACQRVQMIASKAVPRPANEVRRR